MRDAILGFVFGVAATAAFGLTGRDDAIETAFAAGYTKAQAHHQQMLSDTHIWYQAKPERCIEIVTTDMTAREFLWHLKALCDNGIEVDTYEYP